MHDNVLADDVRGAGELDRRDRRFDQVRVVVPIRFEIRSHRVAKLLELATEGTTTR